VRVVYLVSNKTWGLSDDVPHTNHYNIEVAQRKENDTVKGALAMILTPKIVCFGNW
jgi:hypothetical protein